MPTDLFSDPLLLITPIIGLVLLVWGRRLFWLLVGCAGFLLASQLCNEYLAAQATWIRIAISITAGLVGIILALMIQRLAFAIAGYYAGVTCGLLVLAHYGNPADERVFTIIGGLLGALLAMLLMDHVIILLACLIGANAILDLFTLTPLIHTISFIVLVVAGFIFQFRQLQPKSKE
ncbi:MAG: DUF4203 domain-containing protein [Verrucomicrobiota bacterium]|nr:DUF4203 domain-containing protein [Verrucomicrobiota bacterium]